MARLIPLVLIALAVWFWLRARKKTATYMASYEAPSRGTDGGGERREPPAA
ncbi:hypothetical protein OG206_12385 [Streptomyces sp. NBC_01341]|uniref:hypothetical protein n=1 Tax=Streptomyces sp. NBC_01341 TaxID=2903831 RepID=UPI002E14E1DB|nr:hypothetical protein OG206_12385 [Streptomyces sp. NBC_01341]